MATTTSGTLVLIKCHVGKQQLTLVGVCQPVSVKPKKKKKPIFTQTDQAKV